uniref:MARVEL domain-containing protein n=1 Tax=Sciurus vulgaris TaxID=55149 RepID=A0A8D2E490_SCIVU
MDAREEKGKERARASHVNQSETKILFLSLQILIIAAVVSFVVGQAHETFIAITIQEACIVLFFILIYMVTLQHLLVFLDWTLFDLINSFISAVFLLIVAVLTWQEKERRPLFYIGGVFCLTAAILCLIDASLVTKKMRNNMKVILGIKVKTPSQHRDPWVPAYPTPRRERRPALGLSCKAS